MLAAEDDGDIISSLPRRNAASDMSESARSRGAYDCVDPCCTLSAIAAKAAAAFFPSPPSKFNVWSLRSLWDRETPKESRRGFFETCLNTTGTACFHNARMPSVEAA